MNIDPWEQAHRDRAWGRWPAECVVRFVMKTYGHLKPEERRKVRILDVGCGAGATSWFLLKEGFDVLAIDSSRSAVARAAAALDDEYQNAGSRVFVSRATQIELGPKGYDCVVDVACLQCLPDLDLMLALQEIARVLKPGGRFFSRHASDKCWPGIHTVGTVYNRTFAELDEAYGYGFDVELFHEEYERRDPARGSVVRIAHWLIEGVRK